VELKFTKKGLAAIKEGALLTKGIKGSFNSWHVLDEKGTDTLGAPAKPTGNKIIIRLS
jgi:hypothetical protein